MRLNALLSSVGVNFTKELVIAQDVSDITILEYRIDPDK